jgi:hypothetical protein
VVDTDDVLLVCPRNHDDRLKQLMQGADPKYL